MVTENSRGQIESGMLSTSTSKSQQIQKVYIRWREVDRKKQFQSKSDLNRMVHSFQKKKKKTEPHGPDPKAPLQLTFQQAQPQLWPL